MQLSLIDPEAFKDGFNLRSFLSGIADSVLNPKTQPAGSKPDCSTAAAAARVSLDKSRALLELFDKAESEALSAHGEVSRSVVGLQTALAADQAKYQSALASCQRQTEAAREAFRRVEGHSGRAGQVGTRLGDRLQRADGLRSRAVDLTRLLEQLALFVGLADGDAAFSDGLPGLFWEERRMAEAAAVAHQLRALTAEVAGAGERNRLAGAAAAAEDAAPREVEAAVGSLEYGTRRLGQYCVWLENRVVGRFDQAYEDDNLRVMAECARIMAAVDRERVIIQRYVSLLPVFQSPLSHLGWLREPAVAADDAVVSERLRPLSRLYGTLGDTVAVEAGRMSAVFPSVRTALQMLVTRVFEDRVTQALERLLEDTAEDAFSSTTSFSSGRPLDELDDDLDEQYDDEPSSSRRRGGGYKDSGADSDSDDSSRRPPRPSGAHAGSPKPPLPAAAVDRQMGRGGGGGSLPSVTIRTGHTSVRGLRMRQGGRGGDGGDGGRRHSDDSDDGDVDGGGSSNGPSVLALHLYLRLLAASYVRTGELAEQIGAVTSGHVDVGGLVDVAFGPFLRLYPAPELQWLDLMADKELAADRDSGDPLCRPPLSLAAAEALIRRNAEAVQRCALLCPAAQVPASIRLLYVGEAPYDGTMPGSLLEHLPRYLVDGVEREMELTLQLDGLGAGAACDVFRLPYQPPAPPGGKGPPPPLKLPPPVTRAAAAQAGQSYVAARMAPVLRAVWAAGRVVARLQEHHVKVVLPPLESAAAEASACTTGLALALRGVEGAMLSVLHALVDMFLVQAEKVLMYEQRRSEFLAPEELLLDAAALDRPTDACLLVCGLLEALGGTVRGCLEGSNLGSFLLEVGLRLHATLLNHMRQFVYNAAGALRWRNDVASYSTALRGWGLPLLDSRMAAVGALVGVLVVGPEQLLPLVNGTLRLDHREAIKYIRLRSDFPTARLQGRSLQQVFGSGDTVPGQPSTSGPPGRGGGAGAGAGTRQQ